MEQEINIIGTLDSVYKALTTIHVCGDQEIIVMGNVFRSLSAVMQKLYEDEQKAKEAAAKQAEEDQAKVPPHKRKADGGNPVE